MINHNISFRFWSRYFRSSPYIFSVSNIFGRKYFQYSISVDVHTMISISHTGFKIISLRIFTVLHEISYWERNPNSMFLQVSWLSLIYIVLSQKMKVSWIFQDKTIWLRWAILGQVENKIVWIFYIQQFEYNKWKCLLLIIIQLRHHF